MSKDIPIIFSAPMVRALLEGRKTMTRRVLYQERQVRNGIVPASMTFLENYPPPVAGFGKYFSLSPWRGAKPGDRLWVRENWYLRCVASDVTEVVYKASTGEGYTACVEQVPTSIAAGAHRWIQKAGIHPSIHMPRWASRLTLIVSAVKIERLQDISNADAIAEGVAAWRDGWSRKEAALAVLHGTEAAIATNNGTTAQRLFYLLWTWLHGAESWAANPWVVAPTFRVIKANIDTPEASIAA